PDSFQLNSEVTALVAPDGSVAFYDPSTIYCPLGMLSWEKEAVTALVYGKRDSQFAETPITDAATSNRHKSLSVTLSAAGRVDARVESRLAGQRGLEFRSELAGLTSDGQRKRIASDLRELLPTALVDESSITVSNLTQATAQAGAAYNFSVPQFAERTGRRLLMRPALLTTRDESLFVAPRRSNNIYFRYPWSESERMVITLPEGFTVEQLPPPVDLDIGAASYRASFSREKNQLIYERRLTVNAIFLNVDQYATVKAFFDRVHQADRALVSFKQE
ncbi:MAG TPA: hypothetical protein VJQ56_16290, partial [Blastocatellia bacterium]|nr:hypothetical protein [Blastocatellia bacterium]